jgi:hypothetical protein
MSPYHHTKGTNLMLPKSSYDPHELQKENYKSYQEHQCKPYSVVARIVILISHFFFFSKDVMG